MNREVTVQWVHTVWTKKSRGGAPAAVRNAAPAGFRLPGADRPFAHRIEMREEDAFAPRDWVDDLRSANLRLRQTDGRLVVQPRIGSLFTVPPRPRRPPGVGLAPGERVRWQLNYRFSSALGIRGWTYWLDTLNVAYGPCSPDVFLGTPTRYVDERGPLR